MESQNESGTRRELSSLQQQVQMLLQTVQTLEQTAARLQGENERLREELQQCRQELQEYKDGDGQHPTQRLDEPYSVNSEEQREKKRAGSKRRRKQKSHRRGRRTTAEKIAAADREEDVFPPDVLPDDCTFDYSRVMTRIENGRAVCIAYHLYQGPCGEKAVIPGSLGRCEYGMEIAVSVAFLVFQMRLSMDARAPSLRCVDREVSWRKQRRCVRR